MAGELVNMGEQFSGLPMASLIGAPLKAACESQLMLAKATADFIASVGFKEDKVNLRTAQFGFKQRVPDESGKMVDRDMVIEVPLLAIVNIPSLAVKTVDIVFDMEVKSSFEEKSGSEKSGTVSAKVGWGWFSASVSGTVSSHQENTRKSDNSAKYHVQVLARDDGMPEGLSRVLDIMQSSITPREGAAKGSD